MDLLERTKEICKLYDIWPSRSKGQNFLIEETVYDKIIAAADLRKTDTVLEVGPGLGFLTAKLAKAAGKVIAVELDKKLFDFLADGLNFSELNNLELLNDDILKLKNSDIISKLKIENSCLPDRQVKFKIVANLPYNITSIFLRKFLSNEPRPELMVLLLQKEVAQRICAKPGKMSLLALSVQFYAEPEIIDYAPKENFWPMPKVDSAIIKIKIKSAAESAGRNAVEASFFRLAKFGFSARRKMLKNNLAAGLRIEPAEAEKILLAAGLDPKVRAEDLTVADWVKIADRIKRITHNA